MKKLIALLLVLVMCVGMFAACAPADDVNAAAEYLWSMYSDKEGKPTTTDYQVVAKVIVDGVEYTVEWASNNDKVTVAEGKKAGFKTITIPTVNAEEFEYKLTATIKAPSGATATKVFTRNVPVVSNSGITSEPVPGTAYKLFLYQAGLLKTYYALNTTQNGENKFINTTEDPKAGADFYVEADGEGFKFYTEIDGTKTYVFAKTTTAEDGKVSKFIGFNAEEGSTFVYNEDKGGVWMVEIGDETYGVGAYGTYQTISISEGSYYSPDKVGSSQYVVKLITSDVANTLVPDEAPEAETDASKILNTLYGLAAGDSASGAVTLTGKITALDSYGNPTIVVEGFEDKPVLCYKLTDSRFVIDAVITVTATQMKNYNGTYEFMNCVLDDIVLPDAGDTETNTNAAEILNALYGLADGDSLSGSYTLTGKITELDSYNNPTIVVEGFEDKPVYCYRLTDDRFVVGATITVTATQMKNYKGTYEFMSCTLDSIVVPGGEVDPPAGDDENPSITGVQPVVGTAYNVGFLQGKLNKVFYITGTEGGYNNYYMATSENIADAAKVYLEETTGGYYLYCSADNGATKVYINIVQSGTHFNPKFEATASTVYVWDADLGTMKDSVNGKVFGTSNSNTYDTIGPMDPSNIFYAVFVAAEGGDDVTPPTGGDDEGDDPVPATMPYTAGVAYKFYMEQVKLGGKYYFNGLTTDKSYRLATTDWVYDAVDVYIEEVKESDVVVGFRFYFMNGTTKTYIDAIASGDYQNIALTETPTSVFTYNETHGTFVTMLGEVETYFGAYDTKDYFQASNTSYISGPNASKLGVSQYVLKFELSSEVPALTDAIKVEYVKNHINVQLNFSADGTIELPTSLILDGVVISWTKDGVAYTDSSLAIVQTDAEQTIVLVATISCGEATITETYNVTVAAKVAIGETTTATLTFDAASLTSHSGTTNIFEGNGITLTNNKGTYNNNLAEYTAPARIYSGTEVIIAHAGMTKITFNVNSGKAVDGLVNALTDTANYSVDVNGYVVTVTFNAPVDTLTFSATAQFRLDSIVVEYVA